MCLDMHRTLNREKQEEKNKQKQNAVCCGIKCLPLSWRMFLLDRLPPLKPLVTSQGVMICKRDCITSAGLFLPESAGHPLGQTAAFSSIY